MPPAAAGNRATAIVTINLTDNPPVIENQDFLINDTSAAGDPVGLVVASDVRGIASYTITEGNTDNAFDIDNNGNLTVADPSGFTTTMKYNLTIEVSDEANNTVSAVISITVKDLIPIIPDGQTFQIEEHSLTNSVVDKLVADDDQGITGYQITAGNDGNAFSIDTSGIITLTGDVDIDFETKPEYILTIEVSDTGGNTASAEITITIIDVLLVNVDNVADNANLKLGGASLVTTGVVGSTTYLFAAGLQDSGVSVFRIAGKLHFLKGMLYDVFILKQEIKHKYFLIFIVSYYNSYSIFLVLQ